MTRNPLQPRVLIVDDEPLVRSVMIGIVEHLGLAGCMAQDGEQALRMMAGKPFDIVFLDLRLPGMDGLEVLRWCRENHPNTIVIMMTNHPSLEHAVESTKLGALDFLEKPIEMRKVEEVVSTALSALGDRGDEAGAGEVEREKKTGNDLVGVTPAMRELMDKIARVAATDSTVLITGESGTGKDLVARKIHELSPRAAHDYVPVDCSALVESLLESELFGHVKGAFTGAEETKKGLFELADKGTFFFDEISNLTLRTQAKLLRVIQEREFRKVGSQEQHKLDIRILAASNLDLNKAVEKGAFRPDLYYRLNVVPIHLPPLRERSRDIPLLMEYFLGQHDGNGLSRIKRVSDEAMDLLVGYPWPGNVRELQHLVEQVVVLGNGESIKPEDLPPSISRRRGAFDFTSEKNLPLHEMEKRYIQFILGRTKGIRQQAADILGINRKTLAAKIKKYGL